MRQCVWIGDTTGWGPVCLRGGEIGLEGHLWDWMAPWAFGRPRKYPRLGGRHTGRGAGRAARRHRDWPGGVGAVRACTGVASAVWAWYAWVGVALPPAGRSGGLSAGFPGSAVSPAPPSGHADGRQGVAALWRSDPGRSCPVPGEHRSPGRGAPSSCPPRERCPDPRSPGHFPSPCSREWPIRTRRGPSRPPR